MIKLFCLVALGLVLTSCAPSETTHTKSPRTDAPRSPVALGALRAQPTYREAERLLRGGQPDAARRALETLLKAPTLTADERTFLQRQVALCRPATAVAAVPPPAAPTSRGAAPADCGPRALALAAKALGVSSPLPSLTKAAQTDATGTSLEGLERAATTLGLKATGVQVDRAALAQLKPPAVAWLDGDHFVAVLAIEESFLRKETYARIHDPRDGAPKSLPLTELLSRSGGILLTLERR